MALAILNVFNLVVLTPVYLMGFSIAALFFTLNDLAEFKSDAKEDPFAYRKIKTTLLILGITAFMVIPFLSIEWPKEIIESINTFTILCSIGVIFFVMGLKQEKVASEKLKKIIKEISTEAVGQYVNEVLPGLTKEALKEEGFEQMVQDAMEQAEKKRN